MTATVDTYEPVASPKREVFTVTTEVVVIPQAAFGFPVGERFFVSRNTLGEIRLTPVSSIPEDDRWYWENAESRARFDQKVDAAFAEAHTGELLSEEEVWGDVDWSAIDDEDDVVIFVDEVAVEAVELRPVDAELE